MTPSADEIAFLRRLPMRLDLPYRLSEANKRVLRMLAQARTLAAAGYVSLQTEHHGRAYSVLVMLTDAGAKASAVDGGAVRGAERPS